MFFFFLDCRWFSVLYWDNNEPMSHYYTNEYIYACKEITRIPQINLNRRMWFWLTDSVNIVLYLIALASMGSRNRICTFPYCSIQFTSRQMRIVSKLYRPHKRRILLFFRYFPLHIHMLCSLVIISLTIHEQHWLTNSYLTWKENFFNIKNEQQTF